MLSIPVKGPLRSNSLSALLAAVRDGLGVAALPRYVAEESLKTSAVTELLMDWTLPVQEIHAVYSSPRLIPAKVSTFIAWMQGAFGEAWWTGPIKPYSA
jgi:DNA-binding transcriptional LysR family regulator